MKISRILDLSKTLRQKSCFLLGPRQTGKTFMIREQLKADSYYNLLQNDLAFGLLRNPELLRQQIQKAGSLVVIDEVQKIPALLDEVHWLIEERKVRFLLTGSSARKLKRSGVNLLGGRARTRYLHPFSYAELGPKNFDLSRALKNGLIPSIYFSDAPEEDLRSYAGDYLRHEIADEGLAKNIPAFSRFLEVAAFSNGCVINQTKIASDAQVARTTVQEFFEILYDTLIARELPAWKASKKRKAASSSKVFFFDVGVVNSLVHRGPVVPKSTAFGAAFEHFVFHELRSYLDYQGISDGLAHWRTTTHHEVDFVFQDRVAIEVKATQNITKHDINGIKLLMEEKSLRDFFVVCFEKRMRIVDGIKIWPWEQFLQALWADEF